MRVLTGHPFSSGVPDARALDSLVRFSTGSAVYAVPASRLRVSSPASLISPLQTRDIGVQYEAPP